MPRYRDAQGLELTAADHEAAELLERAADAYLGARAETRERLDQALVRDPDCVLARCLDGYLALLSSTRDGLAAAGRAAEAAAAAAERRRPTPREAGHLAALTAWAGGDYRAAVRHWGALLDQAPRDLVAIRVSQFVLSYLGESAAMLDAVERVLPAWSPDVPGYGFVLGCRAYALEETGAYGAAEAAGRRAVALNPRDIWAAHAVAHVREMEGRLSAGIAWIEELHGQWSGCNNFAFHLRWHEALFRLDRDEHPAVLDLYDRDVAPRTTDQYLDLTNAVSLLWRLEQRDVDVGPRWRALGPAVQARAPDQTLVFADLHYLMALAAVDEETAVDRFLEACATRAAGPRGTQALVMADVGLPLARAIVAHRRGRYGDTVDLVLPLRDRIRTIGGSHAQRDLFARLLIDAAARGGRLDLAADLLRERLAARPRNVWAWTEYAAVLDAQHSPAARDAARRAAALRDQ